MGYERKRGKLADLNALLRGRGDGRFSLVVGDTGTLQQVKYVITLDADTQLPRDAARLMVGAMMHPLNRARYDERRHRVTEGYGILQPRVAVSLPGANRSQLRAAVRRAIPASTRTPASCRTSTRTCSARARSSARASTTWTRSTRAVGGRFPENRILSHDLLEGCYARAGLRDRRAGCTKSTRPATRRTCGGATAGSAATGSSWRWLLPGVPGPNGRAASEPAARRCRRWKLFDNLRRSLVPAALIGMLLLVWARLSPAWAWTIVGVGSLLLPAVAASLPGFLRKPDEVAAGPHLEAAARSIGLQFLQAHV